MSDPETSTAGSPFPTEIVGGDVVLTLIPDQLFLEFADGPSPEEIAAFYAQHRVEPVKGKSAVSRRRIRVRVASEDDPRRLCAKICEDDSVRTASPVYHRADLLPTETPTSFCAQILIRVGPNAPEKEIAALVASHELEVMASEPFVRAGTLYQLRLRFPKRQDIFAIVDALGRSPLVQYAAPDWMQLHSPASTTPNDPLFNQQWNLNQIAAPAGWDITQGISSVVIAIIDSGCDLNHPDLAGKYVHISQRLDVVNDTHTPDDVFGHGTFCAGIAAAITDNGIGVAGVAPRCSIMPIRLYVSDDEPITSEFAIARAVNWARIHHANVINCSWFYNYPHVNADIAFNDAHAFGIVIVAASGNHFSDADPPQVDYPASHPYVIAIGATDKADRRQVRTNGFVPPWDSKCGPELSVMAPGVFCPSTVIATNPGLKLGKGYDFNYGTSAAAPHVAGLAALLRSLLQHPGNVPAGMKINDLVRSVIEKTAAKVGGYVYAVDAAHPNGTWNVEMGYGRIDVDAALRYARDEYTTYLFQRVTHDFMHVVEILFGLTQGGSGVVLPPGGGPVPVDPGWYRLSSAQRDVLLALAMTELAKGVSDPDTRKALGRAGWEAIERTARRIGPDE